VRTIIEARNSQQQEGCDEARINFVTCVDVPRSRQVNLDADGVRHLTTRRSRGSVRFEPRGAHPVAGDGSHSPMVVQSRPGRGARRIR
jgi:hypothetical protein